MVTPALYSGEELTPQSESEMGLLTPGGGGGGEGKNIAILAKENLHFFVLFSSYFGWRLTLCIAAIVLSLIFIGPSNSI